MAKRSTQWTLEPHTAAKHEILRQYLNAWFPILGSQHRRVVFLDGFAGPGVYRHGEVGSPIIALQTLLDHGYFPIHVQPSQPVPHCRACNRSSRRPVRHA